ncbi:hypothetical protein [uncultured Treponema sp.]|uniref:hypothetical protein n=1 Tax=uncultured Treponema sp. TaxID=162155 RepID=UPI0025CCB917|nr:hypothetical protein [uncultured Treponema sp.]
MKKSVFFISICAAVLVFSCDDFSNLEMPESLSIKTAAKFEFPMGNGAISIREKAGIEKIQEILNENIEKNNSSDSTSESSENSESTENSSEKKPAPEVYEYAPTESKGDNPVMQYVINYPIKEIPLRIDDGTGDKTDLSNIQIPETTFEAPDFNASISETMTITGQSFPMAELGVLGPQTMPEVGFDFDITDPDFATMEIRKGSMNIKIVKPTATSVSADFSMLVKISLVEKNNRSKVIATTGDELIECANGADIVLDLAGASLVPQMYINVEGTVSGGTLGKTHTYGVSMSPSDDFSLKKITGLNMSKEDLAKTGNDRVYVARDFELTGLNSSLKEATIEKGELDFYCALPKGWSGIKIKKSNFLIRGGINIPNSDFSLDKDTPEGYILYKTASLDNKKVVPQTTYTYESDVVPDDASTYDGDNVSWLEVALENAEIIFADSSAGEKTELVMSGSLRIESLTNIKISLEELTKFEGEEDTGLNLSTLLSDVLKGENQDLIEDIEFADSEDASLSGYLFVSQPTENEVLQSLEIEGTVVASYTDKKGNPQPDLYLLGESETIKGRMSMKNPSPSIRKAAEATEEKEANVIVDSSVFSKENYSAKIADGKISKLINDKPDGLKVKYNLGLASDEEGYIELEGNVVNALKNSDSVISISLALIVPLQLKLKDVADVPEKGNRDNTITIEDVMSLSKSENSKLDKDLLNRDSAEDSEDWVKYAEAVKKFEFTYTVDNNIILNGDTVIDEKGVEFPKGEHPLGLRVCMYAVDSEGKKVTWFGEEEDGYCKELDTSEGQHSFEFSKDETISILKNYPFIPKFMIEIPADGSLQYVPRDGSFGISGKVRVEFDENVSVEVWNKNDKKNKDK